jgi:hypothetical protein
MWGFTIFFVFHESFLRINFKTFYQICTCDRNTLQICTPIELSLNLIKSHGWLMDYDFNHFYAYLNYNFEFSIRLHVLPTKIFTFKIKFQTFEVKFSCSLTCLNFPYSQFNDSRLTIAVFQKSKLLYEEPVA